MAIIVEPFLLFLKLNTNGTNNKYIIILMTFCILKCLVTKNNANIEFSVVIIARLSFSLPLF